MEKIINSKNKDLTITEKVELFCHKHSLSETVKDGILNLCKNSYIKGSNDCHEIWKNLNKI